MDAEVVRRTREGEEKGAANKDAAGRKRSRPARRVAKTADLCVDHRLLAWRRAKRTCNASRTVEICNGKVGNFDEPDDDLCVLL